MADVYSGLLTSLQYVAFTDPAALTAYLNAVGFLGLKDRLVGVYAIPKCLVKIEGGYVTNNDAYKCTLTINKPQKLVSTGNDGYVPKNKKLLTYPYVYAGVSTGGKEQHYVFEKSYAANGALTFNVYGIVGTGTKLFVVPTSYDHLSENYNASFEDSYPLLSAGSAPFVELLGSNGIVSKLIPMALTAATMTMPTATPLPVKSEVGSSLLAASPVMNKDFSNWGQVKASGVSSVTQARMAMDYEQSKANAEAANAARRETLEKYHITSHTVPQIAGCVNFNNFKYQGGDTDSVLATGLKGIHANTYSLRLSDAQAIDDFFTVYGYTCDKVKVPNTHVRTRFTYTKTQGCRIKPKVGGGGVAGYYMAKICSIFDSGITFWQKNATVGDYTGTNAILP